MQRKLRCLTKLTAQIIVHMCQVIKDIFLTLSLYPKYTAIDSSPSLGKNCVNVVPHLYKINIIPKCKQSIKPGVVTTNLPSSISVLNVWVNYS